jgi:hypothetical protein
MVDERICLKVKLKSLAAEAKIIRKEEKRAKVNSLREKLYRHRIDVVRHEARHTYLAYGFLRGREYDKLESTTKIVDWDKIQKMVERYGRHAVWEKNAIELYRQDNMDAYRKAGVEVLAKFKEWRTRAELARSTVRVRSVQ